MQPNNDFLGVVYADDIITADRLSKTLRITKGEMALAFGLPREAVSKKVRLAAGRTQSRLRDGVEILNRVIPWCGSVAQAFAWYRSQPLAGFGGMTAEQLVKTGQAQAVKDYLDEVAVGGFA